jgi:hypothetical protein
MLSGALTPGPQPGAAGPERNCAMPRIHFGDYGFRPFSSPPWLESVLDITLREKPPSLIPLKRCGPNNVPDMAEHAPPNDRLSQGQKGHPRAAWKAILNKHTS